MRKKRQINVIFRVALVLFCLVLFSAHLSSGILAKYKTEGDDSGTARVAASGMTVSYANPTSDDDGSSIVLDENGSASYTFTAKNTGEVAVAYSFIVSLNPGVLTSDQATQAFSNVKINTGSASYDGVYDGASDAYVFANIGKFAPGDSANYSLTFDTNDLVEVDNTISQYSLSHKNITVLISAKTEQIN